MAKNKPVNADKLDADLTAVANAIREKAGITDILSFPDGMVAAIKAIDLIIPEDGNLYYAGIAESVWNMDGLNFETSAIGELTEEA